MFKLVIMTALLGAQPAQGTSQINVEDAQVKLISEVRVPAREAGVLAVFEVQEGDQVKRGQLLGKIDDRLARVEAELAKFEHQIAAIQSENDVDERYARKSLEVSQSELKRSIQANTVYQDSVSKTEIERLQLVADRSSLSIEQAQRDNEVAVITERLKDRTVQANDLRIDHRQIQSPMEGTVAEVFVKSGEWLNPGDPVVRVVRLDRLRVEAYLDGKKFGQELQGRPVQLAVTLPPGDRVDAFRGKVVFVSPEIQPVTGEVRIWAEVDNHNRKLRPGDRGILTITLPGSSSEHTPTGEME